MAEKKKNKMVRKASSKPAKKSSKPTVKKVDIVEEAKKELKKMEMQQTQKQQKTNSGRFAWGTFIGAVLLTVAAIIIGNTIKDQIQISKINKFLPGLVGNLGGGMEVEQLGKLKEENGLFTFSIKFKDYDEEFTSAVTKDGKRFFVDTGIIVEDFLQDGAGSDQTANTETATCETLNKVAEPKLVAYVTSDCGHCQDAEEAMAQAIKNNPDLAKNLKLNYNGTVDADNKVISFLGGEESGTENLRQVCIREKDPNTFWDYIGCMVNEGETTKCQTTAKVNTAVVDACMTDGSGLTAIKADFEAANQHAIQGTPSFFMNDEQAVADFDFGGRTAEAYQQMICCASETPGASCEI